MVQEVKAFFEKIKFCISIAAIVGWIGTCVWFYIDAQQNKKYIQSIDTYMEEARQDREEMKKAIQRANDFILFQSMRNYAEAAKRREGN